MEEQSTAEGENLQLAGNAESVLDYGSPCKRGQQGPAICTLCDQEPETIGHLLLNCSFSKTLWFRLCREAKHPNISPGSQTPVITWWNNTLASRKGKQKKITATLMIAGMRRIWLERNARVFEGNETPMDVLVRKTCEELAVWAEARKTAEQREE